MILFVLVFFYRLQSLQQILYYLPLKTCIDPVENWNLQK